MDSSQYSSSWWVGWGSLGWKGLEDLGLNKIYWSNCLYTMTDIKHANTSLHILCASATE